jgi:hypothetical protein
VDSLGVNLHLYYRGTPYANFEKVAEALSYLGISHVRDVTPLPDTRPYDYLANNGIRFDLFLRGETVNEMPQTIQRLEAFMQRHPGSIASIEGMNEVNNWPAKYKGETGFPAAIAVQRDLYSAVKASPVLHGLPVYMFTLGAGGPADYDRLGDLSSLADAGNAHIYFGNGAPPNAVWDGAYALARRSTPRLPQAVVTETGYTTSTKHPQGVDEQVQAKYTLTLVAEAWAKSVPRIFFYQLADDTAEDSDWTRKLGLYRFDWSKKPVADALHNLTSTLLAGSGTTGTNTGQTATLNYGVSPSGDGTQSLLVRQGNGALGLILWKERKIWDGNTRKASAAEPTRTTLTLGGNYSTVEVVDPLDNSKQTVRANGGRLELDLGDHPLIVEIPGTAQH